MLVSAAASYNTLQVEIQPSPKNEKNKRKHEQDTKKTSKRIKLDSGHENHQKHIKKEWQQKELSGYKTSIPKKQPNHQRLHTDKIQVDTKHRVKRDLIPTNLKNILTDIRKMDIEYANNTDKYSEMPEHKRLPIHGNLVCVEKINHLLVRDTNQLIKELEPIKNQPQHLIEYAKRVAELVKKYNIATCDEMTHLMASRCLEETDLGLFKMVINFFGDRPDSSSGKMARPKTHVCLMVCPSSSGDDVQAHCQWYETQHKVAYSDLLSPDGKYHQPSYLTKPDIYIADPCEHKYWSGSNWQQYIEYILSQYKMPADRKCKKIQVLIEPYLPQSNARTLAVTGTPECPVKREIEDYSAMPAYTHLKEFAEKTSIKVPRVKQRAIEIILNRLRRVKVVIPSWEAVKQEHRRQWTTHLIRFSAWKMNLDVKVLYRDDLEIIDPESQDYYQYMVAFLGQAKCESAGAINNMSNSFNSRGLLLPDPDLTHFSTSRKWMPGHIRHLIKVAKPERSFSDTELITILREMDPAKSKDKFLRYLHEYLQSKLANKRDVRIIQNACSTLSKGNIPLPAIEGVTQWSVPVVRELADMCFEKFGGIQPDTVITPPVDKKVPIPSPEHKNEFDQWFLKKLKSNQYNFDTFSAKLKESGRIVTISPIEGISFHDVPEKADWLLYYVYHHGFNRKEIDDNAFTNTLYQMLERIKSREKHLELYNSLIYIASTWSGLRSLAYIESLKRHNIRLPDDLINHTLKGRLIEMHQRAKALQESGWISADIDLTRSKAKVRTSKP